MRAFRQRFDRLASLAPRLSLERLCERIMTDHDYDLAVLAQWDGRRRYANLRKLARLARSYEELRGPDVEGFVRFVRELDTVGASELEAVAEEEGTDVIRLLTIHGAKGLEFKVVVVADAGRHGASRDADEILCLPDGRLGFRVADPSTGKRRPTSDYQEVKELEDEAAEAERRRLYYVAMTRAIDRLIVSGSIDPERGGDDSTPIGWVLGRLEAPELDGAAEAPVEIDRGGAKLVLRVDRYAPAAPKPVAAVDDESQLALFTVENGSVSIAEAPKLPELVPVPAPPENRVRRLSYSALALFEMCSYRFYAERLVGLRETKPALGDGKREAGLAATEIGDMAHVILEELDLADPRPPDELAEVVRARYATATDEEVARIGVARRRVLRLRDRAPPGRPSGGDRRALVRVRARRGPPARAARRLPRGRRQGARRRLQDERPRGRLTRRGRRARISPAAPRLRPRRPARRSRRGRGRLPVPRASRRARNGLVQGR